MDTDRKHNKKIVPTARMLRKNMTKEERHLWYDFLRNYPVKITRQKVLGRYIADFYCAQAKIAIELDGNQHAEEYNVIKDNERTRYLEGYDITVIRIPNYEVNKYFDGVCEYIHETIDQALRSAVEEETSEDTAKAAPVQGEVSAQQSADGGVVDNKTT